MVKKSCHDYNFLCVYLQKCSKKEGFAFYPNQKGSNFGLSAPQIFFPSAVKTQFQRSKPRLMVETQFNGQSPVLRSKPIFKKRVDFLTAKTQHMTYRMLSQYFCLHCTICNKNKKDRCMLQWSKPSLKYIFFLIAKIFALLQKPGNTITRDYIAK